MSPSLTPKILVVDDENINLTKTKNILQDLDVELVMVTSGEEGLTAVLNTDFAFVLLDVEMPEMNGFDTAALLRENENNKSLPIIFLTTLDAEKIKIFKGYNEGAVSYLFKPLNRELLLRKVGSFIDIYEKTIELERSNAALQEFAQIAA